MPTPTLERPTGAPPSGAASRGQRRLVLALVLLIVVLAAAAAVLTVVHRRSVDEAQRRDAVLVAARTQVLDLVDVSPATAQAKFDQALAGATGAWKQRLVSDGGGLTQAVLSAQVNSKATISEAGVQNADDEHANALVVAQLFVGNAAQPATAPRPLRIQMALEHEADRWLVSDVEFVP